MPEIDVSPYVVGESPTYSILFLLLSKYMPLQKYSFIGETSFCVKK